MNNLMFYKVGDRVLVARKTRVPVAQKDGVLAAEIFCEDFSNLK